MESKISKYIKLKNQPVAVFRSKEAPQNAIQFKEGVWGCVVSMLVASSNGKTVAFHKNNVVCNGGKAGLGLKAYELGIIEYFLSNGEKGPREGEFYKKTPELAKDFVNSFPEMVSNDYVIFKPLAEVKNNENPDIIIFLVNADQLSGLVTLANYDKSNLDNIKLNFGSGCAQSIIYAMEEEINKTYKCTIGLTDPSARKCIDKDLLSFSIPYTRFIEMENNAEGSFFETDTWNIISKRI